MTNDQLLREKNDAVAEVERCKKTGEMIRVFDEAVKAAKLELEVALRLRFNNPADQVPNIVSAFSLLFDALHAGRAIGLKGTDAVLICGNHIWTHTVRTENDTIGTGKG